MRIGRLTKRLRRFTASWTSWTKPEYYSTYTSFDAFGDFKAQISPFDGKAFLDWDWRRQDNEVWYGRSVNGMIPTASIDYPLEGRKETKKNEKDWRYLILFSYPCDNIIVNYTLNLEGVWIEWSEKWEALRITVLRSTRLKVEFKAERHEVLLPPGTTVCLSPLTLMQKLGENTSIEERKKRLPPEVMEVFATARTPQELAKRLELEPIRLREELEDRGEVMSRLVDD